MIVWVLTDDRIGGNNQALALGTIFDPNFQTKKIIYNKLAKIPNFLKGSSLIGINKKLSDPLNGEKPNLIIFAGRRLAPVALNIKKNLNKDAKIIAIMNPNMPYSKFDFILLPEHDRTPQNVKEKNPNIIETIGSLNRIQDQKIKDEAEKWREEISKLPAPYISFIIGGDTKSAKIDPNEFEGICKKLSDLVKSLNGSLLITTSRRTSQACIEKLKENITCSSYLYDWADENSKKPEDKNPLGNPYFAYMGLADFIVVTGESMSMISESCSTGKPVYVYKPTGLLAEKHDTFCKSLKKYGFIKIFDKETKSLEKFEYQPLKEVERIYDILARKMDIDLQYK